MKQRLDNLLVQRGLSADRDQAKRMIMAGMVLVHDTPMDKPGCQVDEDAAIRIKKKRPFVSRAGEKLEGAIRHFKPVINQKLALDLGASTGGFTQCLLNHGAKKVYAVDVGTNQLDYRLRTDPRVVCLEKTHAKKLSKALLPDPLQFLVADVSFTSLKYVLPFAWEFLEPSSEGLCLFKPQFEVPRHKVLPGGMVTPKDADQAADEMQTWFLDQCIQVLGTAASVIKGREGNQEIFFWIKKET